MGKSIRLECDRWGEDSILIDTLDIGIVPHKGDTIELSDMCDHPGGYRVTDRVFKTVRRGNQEDLQVLALKVEPLTIGEEMEL